MKMPFIVISIIYLILPFYDNDGLCYVDYNQIETTQNIDPLINVKISYYSKSSSN